MAPSREHEFSSKINIPQEVSMRDENIVISGISGLYPEAQSVKELSDILYNKENPVTSKDSRWESNHPELTKYVGKAPGVDRFDAQFFSVYYRLGHHMDSMSRKLLEHTYQALYDAGLNPALASKKKIGVFIGSSSSDTEKSGLCESASRKGLGILGCSKAMFANRISYWLNAKGPSISIDNLDCSSFAALEQAYLTLQRGDCEIAIVGGTHLLLHPHGPINHARLGVISKDGNTKSYAENSDGSTMSDAINVVILQKAKDALRCYAEVVHVKHKFVSILKDSTGPMFGYNRNPDHSAEFIREFYKEAQVAPGDVEYIEGFGSGVPDADRSELESFDQVYCKDRLDPLLVGSVTSNIGFSEAASGLSAIIKVLLGYQRGELASNLSCEHPRKDIEALREGRIRIVNEHQRFNRTYTAVNGLSVSGINAHVLLHGHYKPKDLSRYQSSIPRLVVLSGRQESCVESIFKNLKSRPVDAEEIALLQNIHSHNISGHLGRGYIILGTNAENKTVSLREKVEYFDNAMRPLWFVYSGMGSQWPGMGTQLMQIPIFAAAIERCHQVLQPKGLDIVDIITSTDKLIFDNILHSFVGIAAVQIGLTDILRELGLEPDGIIGHSVGELGCAYADGCLTAEEMILAAYSRGMVSLQTPLIHGSMAAVGLGYDQVSTMCPPEIDVACHNGPDSSTISGPAEVMRAFVTQLTAEGIFAKEVPCSNIAYHSRYIADAGPNLLNYLKDVIKNPKLRSDRWFSTSVPQDKWQETSAKYCSAEYHTTNLLSPVLFEETSRLIPNNAILVEVAPHGLLQAILKRSLSENCRHVPLTRRNHPDNVLFLLEAIGNIYMDGYLPKVQALYPKVEFPVSTETPMLSHLVDWIHLESWRTVLFNTANKRRAATCKFLISIHDEEYSYLRGHVISGKMCYPFAAALVAAWDTFAMIADLPRRDVSIQFQNVHFYAQPVLLKQQPLELTVSMHKATGKFEVISQCSKVASGHMVSYTHNDKRFLKSYKTTEEYDTDLGSEDIYQLLKDKGYNYSGGFRSIQSADASLCEAELEWCDNWITFIDGLLQFNALRQPHEGISQPTYIREIIIDVKEHAKSQINGNEKTVIKAVVDDIQDVVRCGGFVATNIKNRYLPPASQNLPLQLCPLQSNNVSETMPSDEASTKNATLKSAEIGELDSLHWLAMPKLEQSNIVVKVHYAGLNTVDLKRATGVTSWDYDRYGMDYSGITENGDRVMGIVKNGAASTEVVAQPALMWPVPKHWSLEDAATVPFPYAHAFYALVIKGRLWPGMSVLVHGGSGALGQAAITIALAQKCKVLATVSDIRKKQFLLKRFPKMKDGDIGNSRDASFNKVIYQNTRGCDLIISCVKGDHKNVSLKCLRLGGTLIDTVQIQDREIYEFGMFNLALAAAYKLIDFSALFRENENEDMQALQQLVSDGIAAGYVVPLTRVIYEPQEVIRAFQLLGSGHHRGRVLLRMQDFKTDRNEPVTRILCDPTKTQVLVCDDIVGGVQLADTLIKRGARNLYISCNTNLKSYLDFKIRFWKKQGVNVVVVPVNSNNHEVDLKDATSMGPVEGIYVIMINANMERRFDADLILNDLDMMSKIFYPVIRHFLVISTIESAGKDLCLSRKSNGWPATYLDLAGINKEEMRKTLNIGDLIEQALCSQHTILSAQTKHSQTSSLLKQIAAKADIDLPQNAEPDETLQGLGLKDTRIKSICSLLNNAYNLKLEDEELSNLTINQINELEKLVVETAPVNLRGLATFFSIVDSDEMLGTVDLVELPTLYNNAPEDSLNTNDQYLCIVPGMEGQHERFRALCKSLKLPAFVLQPGLDDPEETGQELAQRYAQVLKEKTEIKNNFYLLGYESGVSVALELAAILEDLGLVGTVFCVGCTPDELQAEIKDQLSHLETTEQLQDAVARHMVELMADDNPIELVKLLGHTKTWSEKVDVCVEYIKRRTSHSAQYARGTIEAVMSRIVKAQCYSASTRQLRSKLILLRAITAQSPLSTLQQYSEEPVIVHQLQSPLSNVLDDMECSSLINQYLNVDTQISFKQKNLCYLYPISTQNTFIHCDKK